MLASGLARNQVESGPESIVSHRPQAGTSKSSLQLPESNRPNSTGPSRASDSLQLDSQLRNDEDGHAPRAHHPVPASRDTNLRGSKDGRPASRPAAPAAQSPYLQPPGGRASQGGGHRPNSRQPPPQTSPQPQRAAQQSQTLAGGTTSGTTRSSGSGGGAGSFTNGARIIQTYCAPVGKPTQQGGVSSSMQLHSLAQPKAQAHTPSSGGPVRQQLVADQHPQHQHQQHASQAQVQAALQPQQQAAQPQRATTAQQQQQQAGPRATTAFSGARASQRGRQDSSTGQSAEAGQRGAGAPSQGAHPHALNHPHGHHPAQYGGGPPHGQASSRENEVNSTSFGYEDIPVEDDESASPSVTNAYSGLTLDQYMQRMVTTPASAAATSGLGVSADSEESAPCSPGNASTRTEDDDAPYASPTRTRTATHAASPLALGRAAEGDRDRERDRQVRASRASGAGGGAPGGGGGGVPGSGQPVTGQSPPGIPRIISTARNSGPGGVGAGGVAGGASQRSGLSTALSGGVRSSGTNTVLTRGGPGGSGMAAGMGRGGEDGHAGGSGGGAPLDISSLMDDDSSDDDQHNPAALINSPRTARHLSSRASAMAFSNSLDLRPATAAVVSSPSMTRGDSNTGRGMAMGLAADGGNHHAIIKQVDLGGLSASLFTPNNPNSGRDAGSPAASAANNLSSAANDLHIASNPSSPDLATMASTRADRRGAAAVVGGSPAAASMLRASSTDNHAHVMPSPKNPMAAIPPPWGVSAREGAFGAGPTGDGTGGAGSLQALAARPLSSRGRPAAAVPGGGGADAAASSPSGASAAAAAGAGRPGSGAKWAKAQQAKVDGGPVELSPEARLLVAEAENMARPPTRQVQSARPPGSRGEVELDPSVWQANIAMQLQRPPSRQKPPPEALHLWTPEQQMTMLATGGLGRNVGGGRPLGGRPQSAAPTTYRTRPTSGPSMKAHGPVGDDVAGSARPPSRQKPPPLSTLLEHDDFPPPPPAGSRRGRSGVDELDVVVSGSDDDDDDDILDM